MVTGIVSSETLYASPALLLSIYTLSRMYIRSETKGDAQFRQSSGGSHYIGYDLRIHAMQGPMLIETYSDLNTGLWDINPHFGVYV